MDGTGAKLAQSRIVGLSSVTLVNIKAILGIGFCQFQHKIVPGNLGKNGGRGNVCAEAVPLDHGFHRNTEVRLPVAVDEG